MRQTLGVSNDNDIQTIRVINSHQTGLFKVRHKNQGE